jgi:signal transduction histidine kinase
VPTPLLPRLVETGSASHDGGMSPRVKRWVSAWLASVLLVALVTAVIKLLHPHGPARGLAVLYIPAVVAVAVRWGPAFAFVCSLLSVLTFDYFFLGTQGRLEVSGAADIEAFAAFLATAIMAGLVASRLRRQAQEAQRLAAEQASLRHIASLVARGASPADVVAGIADELAEMVGTEVALLFRHDPTGLTSLTAAAGVPAEAAVPTTAPWPVEPSALVKTVRFDGSTPAMQHSEMFGSQAEWIRGLGLESGIASPVVVNGRAWGFVVVAGPGARLYALVEPHLVDYTELLGTAIGNAENRAALAASRARIIAASDETRRKIERDLHDGAQQRLVSLALTAGAARAGVPPEQDELRGELSQIADGLVSLLDELREMARGLHPAILSDGGLVPALRVLARRSPVAVELEAGIDRRLPQRVEVTAYYVASELLANVAKHARASKVDLRASATSDELALSVHDDGVGGADATRGSGLVGVIDRVSANDGTISVRSPIGRGTSVDVVLPIPAGGDQRQ